VSVHVVSSDPLATITPATQSYGTVAAGATKTMPFTLKLAASYPRGKPVSLAATVSFTGGQSPTSTTLSIPVSRPATTSTTFAYTGAPVAIPDNDPVGASVAIPVSGIGYASKLTFSVDGSTCTADEASTTVGIDHTFVGDLVGTLTSPTGQTVTVFGRDGAGGNNLCQVVFDDAATTPFAEATSDQAPFTGTWAPDQPLATFQSAPVDGSWTFKAEDRASADVGSIRAVSLHIAGFAPN
jgi:subtilisin-like proprotein convertase family protein